MSAAARGPLPTYDELPVAPGSPAGSSWGLWGPGDVLGCLNLLSAERVRAGLAAAQDGRVFNLNLPLELPAPPLFARRAFEHVVTDLGGRGHDDMLVDFNTQHSSQWDGFRHIRHPAWGYYNGVADGDHGMHHWAEHGIVGRAVLADVGAWRAAAGRPLVADRPDEITIDDLHSTLDAQNVAVEPGDILLIRTGWMGWYRGLSPPDRAAVARDAPKGTCGLRRGKETARGLWDLHLAAVAADNPALEVMPFARVIDDEQIAAWRDDPEAAAGAMLHFQLLGLLGLPIGELFELDALARHCAATGRFACLLTSSPLNVRGGVASPPNALAIT